MSLTDVGNTDLETDTEGVDPTPLLSLQVDESQLQPPPAPLHWLNTEDYWTLGIGLFWYPVIVGLTLWGLEISHIHPWRGADILDNFSATNLGGLALRVSATFGSLYLCHSCMGKPQALGQYCPLFFLAIISDFVGHLVPLRNVGFGASIWCIVFGMIYGNTIMRYFKKKTFGLEYFIKISITLLAIGILMSYTICDLPRLSLHRYYRPQGDGRCLG